MVSPMSEGSSNKIYGPLSPPSSAPVNQNYHKVLSLNAGLSMDRKRLYDQMPNTGEGKDVDLENNIQLQSQQYSYMIDEEDGSLKDQNADLKAQIRRLESDAEAKQRALDDMLTELMDAQEKLHYAEVQFAAKEDECAGLRAQISQHGTAPSGGLALPEHQRSMVEMQQQIDGLLGALKDKDRLLCQQGAEPADERATRLQLKESVQFFKANSERLGQEIREMKDENLRLLEELDVKQTELTDEKSLNLALKMEAGLA